MKPRIGVSVSEMMELRNQGYSNKDIAKMLDISIPSVYRYIGGQGCHMASVTGGRREATSPPQQPQIKVISQTVAVGGYCFQIDTASKQLFVALPNQTPFNIEANEIDRLTDALKTVQKFIEEM